MPTTLVGFVAAAAIALLARAAGSLTTPGAFAAIVIGTASVAAGWPWGVLLVAYFVVSIALSRYGARAKLARTNDVVAKDGARDAAQVVANGAVFAAFALLAGSMAPDLAATMRIAALGALAASAADTWATEIGTLLGGAPRSVLTWRPVAAGTSGGVSVAGSVAMAGGALFVALLAYALGLTEHVVAVAAAGVAGAVADSLLGATLQQRRWCATCESATERAIHGCGANTSLSGGLEWIDNDAVNLFATVVGAAIAALLAGA
jgi:uncharacterized protein (TIGR00297 family)